MDCKNIALNIYSFGHAAGFVRDDRFPDRVPALTIDALPQYAGTLGLGGIEFPFDHFFKHDIAAGVAFIAAAHTRGLTVAVDLESFDPALVTTLLPELRREGIPWCRVKLPHALYGGAQYTVPAFGQWRGQFIRALGALVPLLRALDMRLLVENHQDFFVQDLIDIIRAVDDHSIGINWDIGNSLAIGATPEQFYDVLGPYIGNIHLKDYRLVPQEKGIGLERCALGVGVVDFETILRRVKQDHGALPMSVELGAQVTRMVDMRADDYWNAMLPVDRARRVAYTTFVDGRLSAPSSAPFWERRSTPEQIMKREEKEVAQSVDFLASLSL